MNVNWEFFVGTNLGVLGLVVGISTLPKAWKWFRRFVWALTGLGWAAGIALAFGLIASPLPRSPVPGLVPTPSVPLEPGGEPAAPSTSSPLPGRVNDQQKIAGPAPDESSLRPDIPATKAPAVGQTEVSVRRLADALSYEQSTTADATSLAFPIPYLRIRLGQALGQTSYGSGRVRISVTFVEPIQYRARATGGAIIGYLYVSLPALGGCSRRFGGAETYDYATPELGMMKAIDSHASEIAEWLKQATENGGLECPAG